MKTLYIILIFFLVSDNLNAQNVGIGTTTPKAKLEVNDIINNPTIPGSSSTGIFRIGFAANGGMDIGLSATYPYGPWIQAGYGGSAQPISLQPLGGYVGIGIATPTLAQLQVEGMVGNTVAMFSGSSTSKGISFVADWPGIFFNSYFNGGVKAMTASGYPSFINTEQTTGALTFNTTDIANTIANDPVTVPERMRISGNGFVGIGTVSPNNILQIHNSTSNSTSLQITNNAGGSTIFDGALITQENDDLNVENLEGAGKINFKNGGVPRMTITSTGLVGINQPNPIAPLDVSGPIRVNDGYQAAGKVLTSDANGNASWQETPGKQVAFQAFMWFNSGPIITQGYFQRLVFDSVGINIGNAYDPITGIFTAPSPGLYYFCFQVFWNSSSTSYAGIKIRKPMSTIGDQEARWTVKDTGLDHESMSVSGTYFLNTGEQIDFGANRGGGTDLQLGFLRQTNYVYGYKIY